MIVHIHFSQYLNVIRIKKTVIYFFCTGVKLGITLSEGYIVRVFENGLLRGEYLVKVTGSWGKLHTV